MRGLRRIWCAIVIFYLALFAFLAFYDEKADPALTALLNGKRPEIIEPQNAWLAMLGGDAPQGSDPYAYGVKVYEKALKASQMPVTKQNRTISGETKEQRLTLNGKMPLFFSEIDMFEYVHKNRNAAAKLIADNTELLKRHVALHRYTHFSDPLNLGMEAPIPPFSALRNGHRLFLLQLAMKAENGNAAELISKLEDHDLFLRKMASDSNMLISNLLSTSMLYDNMNFAAGLSANLKMNDGEKVRLKRLLRGFDNGETSLVKALNGEIITLTHYFDAKRFQRFERLFFKTNATQNTLYKGMQERIKLAQLPADKFVKSNTTVDKNRIKLGIAALYNPVGELLTVIAEPSYSGYIAKGHNLEAMRRLALLKVMIHEQHLQAGQIQPFLNRNAGELGNPYNGKAAGYDAKSGALFFEPVMDKKPIRLKL